MSGHPADDEQLLADMEAAFKELARDPEALAAYRHEARESEVGFEAPAPEW